MSQILPLPIAMSQPISLANVPLHPSSIFVDILKNAIEAYESRTGGSLPTDLKRDHRTPDELRESIQGYQAQACTNLQFSRRVNRLVTLFLFMCNSTLIFVDPRSPISPIPLQT